MTVRKITVEIDGDLLRRARIAPNADSDDDGDVVARVVAAFVGFAALKEAHTQGSLAEDDANALATAVVRAHRVGAPPLRLTPCVADSCDRHA